MGGKREPGPEPTMFAAITTYFNYLLMFVFGYVREFFRRFFPGSTFHKVPKGYAPLVKGFEDFFTRRFYGRMDDCWNRPITGTPGARIDVFERDRVRHELVLTGTTRNCLNLGSYNYLGFADQNEMCRREVKEALVRYGCSTTSPDLGSGYTSLHAQLETEVAAFVGKEAAMIVPMGFATNSTLLPGLVGKGDLLVSDALNHASIVTGARSSGAKITVFRHNSASHLERTLRAAIRSGQPRTGLPWKKILVVVEGIYSMEGELCNLAEIVDVVKRYKAYIWLDEAHSIGCMGKTGRGVCEQLGVDPARIDVMMGTFTKSFGSVGGYVAGSKDMIAWLKSCTSASIHAPTLSPASVQQVLTALKIMRGEDGTNLGKQKLAQLRSNSNMFRERLRKAGFHVLGEEDSPVIPMMLYNPTKIAYFSRECLARNIAVVVVGFPATPLILSRVRFCISAGHDPKDLEQALEALEEVGRNAMMQYNDEPFEKILQCANAKVQSFVDAVLALLTGKKQKL